MAEKWGLEELEEMHDKLGRRISNDSKSELVDFAKAIEVYSNIGETIRYAKEEHHQWEQIRKLEKSMDIVGKHINLNSVGDA